MSNKPKVIILMSTYNGERYLDEQLRSIFNQSYPNIELWVRDDGSKDSTIDILNHYVSIKNNMKVIVGNNIGVCESFFNLLENAPESEYYAFSDQDDIWEVNKISEAVNQLQVYSAKDRAILYCSTLNVVDEKLNKIGTMHQNAIIAKGSSLVDYKGTGCTMVFNKKAKDLAIEYRPSNLKLHDMWLFHTCVFLGVILFDNNPKILYRQHGGNEVGWDMTFKDRWKSRMHSFRHLRGQHYREVEAQNLLSSYRNLLSDSDINLIKLVAEYKKNWYNRIKLILSPEVKFKNNIGRNFWLIVRIICGLV